MASWRRIQNCTLVPDSRYRPCRRACARCRSHPQCAIVPGGWAVEASSTWYSSRTQSIPRLRMASETMDNERLKSPTRKRAFKSRMLAASLIDICCNPMHMHGDISKLSRYYQCTSVRNSYIASSMCLCLYVVSCLPDNAERTRTCSVRILHVLIQSCFPEKSPL